MSAAANTKRPERSAKRRAYDHVKAVVLSRELDHSGFVTEAEVASELGISRTPVREAFRTLEAEGLIELVPNKGAYIPEVSDRQIAEVMDARVIVETFCADRILTRGREVHDALSALIAEQRTIAQAGAVEEFIECDRRFHSTIVAAADHKIFEGFYESLRDRQLRMGVRAVLARADRTERVIAEHEAIVAAFRSADPDAVRTTIELHIRTTMGTLLNTEGASR